MEQLNIFENAVGESSTQPPILCESVDSSKPYINIRGELLPWEEPEYLAQGKKQIDKNAKI